MVKKLLERTLEIEGLLRIIRDGKPLPEAYTLLSRKAVELAEYATQLEAETRDKGQETRDKSQESRVKSQETRVEGQETRVEMLEAREKNETETGAPAEVPMIVMTDATVANEWKENRASASSPAIVMTEEKPAKAQDSSKGGKHYELAEAEEEDIYIIRNILSSVSESNPIKSPQSVYEEDEDDILLTIEDEEELAAASKPQPQKLEPPKKEEAPIFRIEKKENNEDKPEIQLKKEEVVKPAFKRQTKLKSAFSLNDRFLYARELFEGNMKMFDSTLDFIDGIEEYSIIEDYFYGELEWDPENVTVASFMEILRPHFRN
ncbi:MAG: hypothetical protein K2L22_11040 [Muribaculaceae bacterium]|nr:hypothetical protein [Muribaculaceae bacterium]